MHFILAFLLNCERHLIGPDPYQYQGLTTDQIVTAHYNFARTGYTSRTLTTEILKRLETENLSRDDREILSKLLGVSDEHEQKF